MVDDRGSSGARSAWVPALASRRVGQISSEMGSGGSINGWAVEWGLVECTWLRGRKIGRPVVGRLASGLLTRNRITKRRRASAGVVCSPKTKTGARRFIAAHNKRNRLTDELLAILKAASYATDSREVMRGARTDGMQSGLYQLSTTTAESIAILCKEPGQSS